MAVMAETALADFVEKRWWMVDFCWKDSNHCYPLTAKLFHFGCSNFQHWYSTVPVYFLLSMIQKHLLFLPLLVRQGLLPVLAPALVVIFKRDLQLGCSPLFLFHQKPANYYWQSVLKKYLLFFKEPLFTWFTLFFQFLLFFDHCFRTNHY